jgi:hypothetical protein
MNTFTPEEHTQYKEFVDLHAEEVTQYILNFGHNFTPESISKLGNIDAKNAFMDFPDYDENNPLEIADSLVVLYFEYVEDDIEFNKLYDFFSQNLSYCLRKITGVEN